MFDSEVFITVDGITVNATRILGLLMLTAGPGTEILIEAQGPEAEVALKEVTRLINHSMSY
jgi:phosphocarrier protein